MLQGEGDEETGDSCLRSGDQDARIIPFWVPKPRSVLVGAQNSFLEILTVLLSSNLAPVYVAVISGLGSLKPESPPQGGQTDERTNGQTDE